MVKTGEGGVDICVYDYFMLVNGKEMERKGEYSQKGAVIIKIIHTTKIFAFPFTILPS